MFVNPQKVFKEGWVIGALKHNVGVNGIDLTPKSISFLLAHSKGVLTQSRRVFPQKSTHQFIDGVKYVLTAGGVYEVIFKEHVKVPEDKVALLFLRSSLVRCGCQFSCGLYDSGYEGEIGGFLFVNRDVKIEVNFPIVQICFVEAQANGVYKGFFQGKV